MSELIDKEYYEKNPSYSELPCFKCQEKTLKTIGIVSSNQYDIPDKTLYRCDKCSQEAYIEIEWIFQIFI